jgi:hypothetical protein
LLYRIDASSGNGATLAIIDNMGSSGATAHSDDIAFMYSLYSSSQCIPITESIVDGRNAKRSGSECGPFSCLYAACSSCGASDADLLDLLEVDAQHFRSYIKSVLIEGDACEKKRRKIAA